MLLTYIDMLVRAVFFLTSVAFTDIHVQTGLYEAG